MLACGLGEQIAEKRRRKLFSLSACGFREIAFCFYADISLNLELVCAREHVGISVI